MPRVSFWHRSIIFSSWCMIEILVMAPVSLLKGNSFFEFSHAEKDREKREAYDGSIRIES